MEASSSFAGVVESTDQFAERLLGVLNHGALCLMVSLGHRTGLFDALAGLGWSSEAEIAQKANLDSRYVREWLGAMYTGEIVLYDSARKKYFLPPEYAAVLARQASPNNMAVFAQYVPLLGAAEDDVLRAFHDGKGVPYERYPRFHEVMAEDSGQTVLSALEDHILPLIPDVEAELREGINVLDVGCGSGRVLVRLAELFPQSRFVGCDFSAEAIERAWAAAEAHKVENVSFEVADAAKLLYVDSFSLVTTFDAIHDQQQPAAVLRSIFEALRPGGTYFMQDIAASSSLEENKNHPIGPFIYTISCMHCMSVGLVNGGAGLGAAWGTQLARQMLDEAGFQNIRVEYLKHDFQNCFYISRKPL